MLIEMILLGFWARYLYRKTLPEMSGPNFIVEEVCALPTLCTMVEKQCETEGLSTKNNNALGVDNKNFVDVQL